MRLTDNGGVNRMDERAQRCRVATFNLENLDDVPDETPSLETRISPRLLRMDADVLCLQEAHAQRVSGSRGFSALDELLDETPYAGFHRASTRVEGSGEPYAERNLVVLSHFPISSRSQYRNDRAPAPLYRPVTARLEEEEAEPVRWERPAAPSRQGAGSSLRPA